MSIYPTTRYWLDANDTIVQVCSDWDRFALQNGGASAVASRVTGKKIWPFIADSPTRMWLDAILGLVRLKGDVLERPYRCDSPTKKRFMRMKVVPEGSGLICLHHHVMRTEPLVHPIAFRYTPWSGRKTRLRCSLCCRIAVGDRWIEGDARMTARTETHPSELVRYSLCPDCRQRAVKAAGPMENANEEEENDRSSKA